MRITRLVALTVAVAVALALVATPARATREARGSCSGGPSEWRLRVAHETARTLRIRFQIEEGDPGRAWQLFVSDNGVRVYAGTKVADEEGRIRIQRWTRDRAGRDRIRATGVNLDTGETCSGSVSVR